MVYACIVRATKMLCCDHLGYCIVLKLDWIAIIYKERYININRPMLCCGWYSFCSNMENQAFVISAHCSVNKTNINGTVNMGHCMNMTDTRDQISTSSQHFSSFFIWPFFCIGLAATVAAAALSSLSTPLPSHQRQRRDDDDQDNDNDDDYDDGHNGTRK